MNYLNQFYILVLLLVIGCQLETPKSDDVVINENKEIDYLELREIRSIANVYEGGQELKTDVAWWAYLTGFEWISGMEFKNDESIKIKIQKEVDYIRIDIDTDVSNHGEIPIVYNRDFDKEEEADYLKMTLNIENSVNSRTDRIEKTQAINSKGKSGFMFRLGMTDFRKITAGMIDYSISFNTEYVSFFGVKSKKKPLAAKFKFNYQIPQIFASTLYFKSLVLNKDQVREKLGANDWSNSTPETGISVRCNNESVLFEFTKNSFKHTTRHKKTVYHTQKDALLLIKVLDVDYGFNSNDLISDTLIPINKLESEEYIDLSLPYVEELLIYCKFKGKAN